MQINAVNYLSRADYSMKQNRASQPSFEGTHHVSKPASKILKAMAMAGALAFATSVLTTGCSSSVGGGDDYTYVDETSTSGTQGTDGTQGTSGIPSQPLSQFGENIQNSLGLNITTVNVVAGPGKYQPKSGEVVSFNYGDKTYNLDLGASSDGSLVYSYEDSVNNQNSKCKVTDMTGNSLCMHEYDENTGTFSDGYDKYYLEDGKWLKQKYLSNGRPNLRPVVYEKSSADNKISVTEFGHTTKYNANDIRIEIQQ